MTSSTGIASVLRRTATTRFEGVEDLISRFSRDTTGYTLERIVTFPPVHNVQGTAGRLRVNLKISDPASADPGSFSTVELWKADGWLLVDRIPGGYFPAEVPAFDNQDDGACETAARRVQDEQLIDALLILG